MGSKPKMMTDKRFSEILKPLGYNYDVNHDNIYVGDDELIAVVDSIPDGDDWKRDYFVVMVRIPDMDDERTLALRAVCVLHNIEVRELKDSDHR